MMMTDQLINLPQVTGQIIPDNWNIPDDWHMITQTKFEKKKTCAYTQGAFHSNKILYSQNKDSILTTKLSLSTPLSPRHTTSICWLLHTHTQKHKIKNYTYIHSHMLKFFYIKYIFHVYVVFMQVCMCVHTCVHAACRDLRLTLGVLLNHCALYSLRQGLSIEPRAHQ